MAILNYTTGISASVTLAEIQDLLARAGAQAIMQEYDDGVVTSLSFRMAVLDRAIFFKLPCNVQGVHKSLKTSKSPNMRPKHRTIEQAARTAWRIVKDWVEAQLAMIEAEQADTIELFLPFAQGGDGRTVYETLKQTEFKMLTHDGANT